MTCLDNLITLHQQKQDDLQKFKKAMLQKMFPKAGSSVPEIRFVGFTGAWEQRKLGEFADIIGGGTPSTTVAEYWNGNIDWYCPTEIGNQIYVDRSQRKITGLGLQKSAAKLLPANRTVLFTSRASVGDMAILRHSGATNQGFQNIVLKDGCDIYFIYSMQPQFKKYAFQKAFGSTFLEVSNKTMKEMPLFLPGFDEQQKIGLFFSNLDNIITHHQQKLDNLKKVKKAFLQKMFV